MAADPDETTPLERYMSGLEIYISMMLTFSSYETPPMNIDLWEFRRMTDEELSRLSVEEKIHYRGRKFWTFRKNSRRSRRSLMKNKKEHDSMKGLSQIMWSEFIVSLMSVFLQAKISNESLPW